MNLLSADTFGKYLPVPKRKRKKNRSNYRRKKERRPCKTTGCKNFAVARGRCVRCYQYLYQHGVKGGMIDEAKLEYGKFCCFKGCEEPGQGEFDDGDFPLCRDHEWCVKWMMLLEEAGYDVWSLPSDSEWLSARWIALMLANRPDLYDRVYGDTPLFRVFMDGYKFYLPLLKSI